MLISAYELSYVIDSLIGLTLPNIYLKKLRRAFLFVSWKNACQEFFRLDAKAQQCTFDFWHHVL